MPTFGWPMRPSVRTGEGVDVDGDAVAVVPSWEDWPFVADRASSVSASPAAI